MPSAEDFAAAYHAACRIAEWSETLRYFSRRAFEPQELEELGQYQRGEDPLFSLAHHVQTLSEEMNKFKISFPQIDHCLYFSLYEAGGQFASTAHGLAWKIASQTWREILKINRLKNVRSLDDITKINCRTLKSNLRQTTEALAKLPDFDLERLRVQIEIEARQAIKDVCGQGSNVPTEDFPRLGNYLEHDTSQYVDLDQAAAMVHVRKRTLERYKTRGMPPCTIKGGGGRKALWHWPSIRPWLVETFGVPQPMELPAVYRPRGK
jgi:hypothetical protein